MNTIRDLTENLKTSFYTKPYEMPYTASIVSGIVTGCSIGFLVHLAKNKIKLDPRSIGRIAIVTGVISSAASMYIHKLRFEVFFERLPNFSKEEQVAIVHQAMRLFTPNMSSRERVEIVEAVSKVPLAQQEAVITQALRLITPRDNCNQRAWMIEAVSKVPLAQQKAVITQALRLITPRDDCFQRISMIRAISKIPLDQQKAVITQVLRLMNPERDTFFDINTIIQTVSRLPPEFRERIVSRADAQLAIEDRDLDIRGGLGRTIALLETPLHGPLPPIRVRMEAMAEGINTHHNDRDQRTRAALKLLRTNTGEMDEDDIRLNIALFESYLELFSDKDVREKAQFALNGPSRSLRDFPALLGDSTFTVAGLSFSGAELIARLWRFIAEYTDPKVEDMSKERENAKTSIIRALSDCFNEEGYRVCNPGKVQRLVVGVLQGRLEGVNVDNIVMNDAIPVSVAEACNMFFNEEIRALHQEIDRLYQEDPQELLQAKLDNFREKARRFCDENPNVNRVSFLQEIEKYLE